eukprot:jgi/Botrbrau1/13666/Bobra.0292s0015.1
MFLRTFCELRLEAMIISMLLSSLEILERRSNTKVRGGEETDKEVKKPHITHTRRKHKHSEYTVGKGRVCMSPNRGKTAGLQTTLGDILPEPRKTVGQERIRILMARRQRHFVACGKNRPRYNVSRNSTQHSPTVEQSSAPKRPCDVYFTSLEYNNSSSVTQQGLFCDVCTVKLSYRHNGGRQHKSQ